MRQSGERMIVGFITKTFGHEPGMQEMVHDPNGVETQFFRHGTKGEHLPGIFNAKMIRNGHADFHGCRLAFWSTQ